MSAQIQLRRDTSAIWTAANPVLAEGEIGMDMTVNAFKVGDGSSAWNDIDYAGTDITLDDYYTKVEADDAFQPKGEYLTDFVEEDPTVPDHVKGITQDDIDGWNAGGSGGTGSSVHIGKDAPDSPQEGQQWMEVPDSGEATMWIYDGGNDGQWLQHPSGKDGAPGADGKDGADGNIADGATDGSQDGVVATWNDTAKQWTPDSSLTIDSAGDAAFSGEVTAGGAVKAGWLFAGAGSSNLVVGCGGGGGEYNRIQIMKADDPLCFRVNATSSNGIVEIDQQGNAVFKGAITKNGNEPVTTTRDLIETLSTLRNATKDETTIKGLRDAIGNAVGGLIEKFEAMQSTATQEISDE